MVILLLSILDDGNHLDFISSIRFDLHLRQVAAGGRVGSQAVNVSHPLQENKVLRIQGTANTIMSTENADY